MLELDQLENMLGAHQWVSVLDSQGCILAVNPSVELLTGIYRQEWLGQSLHYSLAAPMPEPTREAMWNSLQSGQAWRGLLRTRQRRGGGVLTDTLLLPFRDPFGQQFILDLRNDISLLQSHIGKPDSDAGGDDLLLLCNANGRIQALNRAASRWWPGLMAGGALDPVLRSLDDLLAQWVRRTLAGQVAGGGVLSREVGAMTGLDGRRRAVWVAISARWNREMVLHLHVGATLSGVDFQAEKKPDPSHMLIRQLLSRVLERHPGLQIHRETGASFSGDILSAAWSPTGVYYLCLGDATGTGISAALSCLPALEAFSRQVELGQPLEAVVRAMNTAQHLAGNCSRFLAATVLSLNPESKTVRFWAGGLPDGAMLRPLDAEPLPIISRHPPMGVLDPERFDDGCESRYWSEGMRLALCTEGFSESFVAAPGLVDGVDWHRLWQEAPVATAFDRVLDAWRQQRSGAPLRKDVSFISLTLK